MHKARQTQYTLYVTTERERQGWTCIVTNGQTRRQRTETYTDRDRDTRKQATVINWPKKTHWSMKMNFIFFLQKIQKTLGCAETEAAAETVPFPWRRSPRKSNKKSERMNDWPESEVDYFRNTISDAQSVLVRRTGRRRETDRDARTETRNRRERERERERKREVDTHTYTPTDMHRQRHRVTDRHT